MSPRLAPAVALPAAKIAAWRLARQRLPAGGRAGSPAQVARDLVGVQAQVVSAASLAIAIRSRGGRVLRTSDVAAIESTDPTHEPVHLLGAFDPLIVGGGLRGHLIPVAHLKRVSRTAGWISPVVLVDGRAAGVWDIRRAGDRVTITVDAFTPFDRARKVTVEGAAERVATAQGAIATIAYGPVFAADRAANKLTIGPRDA